MPPAFRSNNILDIQISKLVGLETYKALYTRWKSLYSYISYPLDPTNYFVTLVDGVVGVSGFSDEIAGTTIKDILSDLAQDKIVTPENYEIVAPLIGSSYPIENLNNTPLQNFLWITLTVFLSLFLIWYLYKIGVWEPIFSNTDGFMCEDCPSVFERFAFW